MAMDLDDDDILNEPPPSSTKVTEDDEFAISKAIESSPQKK